MTEEISLPLTIVLMLLLILFGFCIGGLIFGIDRITISTETAIEICQQLDGNTSKNFEVSNFKGNLICKEPSFDNTHSIIFKSNAED